MSSPMSSTSIPSQSYLDQLGFGQNHLEEFTDHISMNSSYSMQQNVMDHALNQIHGSAAPKSSMTEHLPFYQAPPVQHTQHLIQGSGDPEIWQQPEQQLPAAQPQQIERQRVGKEVLVARSQRPFLGRGNPRIHWSDELHARFVRAVFELGGVFSAKPKAILEKMNVTGMKIDQVKSHLQKYRTREGKKLTHQGIQNSVNSHSPQLSGQGSSTSRSTAPVNGKGLESFQADIGEYGKLLQSSKTPNYSQDLIYATMGDYQDNVMQTPNYSQDLIYTPMGDQLDNVMQTPNYSQNLIYAPMGDYQDNVMHTPNYSQDLIYAPMGDQQDNVMQTPNYSENLIYAPMDDYQDNVMQTQNYFQNLLLAPMGDYEDNANGYNYFGL